MVADRSAALLEKLDGLRAELVDLAYALERTGRVEAADVAIQVSARVGELCAEASAEPSDR